MKHSLQTPWTMSSMLVLLLGSCVSSPSPAATFAPDPSTRVEIVQGHDSRSNIPWFEARETGSKRVLTRFALVIFDDVNDNAEPDDGEILSSESTSTFDRPSSFIRIRSIDGKWPFPTHRLTALASVTTTASSRPQTTVWPLRP
jgi:hypothetical protein